MVLAISKVCVVSFMHSLQVQIEQLGPYPESLMESQMASRALIWTSIDDGMSVQSLTRACDTLNFSLPCGRHLHSKETAGATVLSNCCMDLPGLKMSALVAAARANPHWF